MNKQGVISSLMNSFWSKNKDKSIVTCTYLMENKFLCIMEDGSVTIFDIQSESVVHTFDYKLKEENIPGKIKKIVTLRVSISNKNQAVY